MARWLDHGVRLRILGRGYRVHYVDWAAQVVYVYTWRDVVAKPVTFQATL
jgi:hypothetical protein